MATQEERLTAVEKFTEQAAAHIALPQQESDFVFFKLHTFSGSFLRFHGIPPLH